MKIAIVAHLKHPIAEPFAGGLEMHTHALCKSLRQRGHEVTLFAAAGSAEDLGLEAVCDQPARNPDLTDAAFRHEHRTYLALMENLRHRDFDIIHNNSLHYVPLALASGLPMPMVTVLHTPPFWEMEGSMSQNEWPNSAFVAVSSHIRDLWSRIARVDRVIHNGIDLERFRFAPSPQSPLYVVWTGRIVPEKGLHLAIAASRKARLDLRIAGPISDRAYFERDIAPALDQHARYAGHLSHSELANLIGGASALLFSPLWDEPYGLVLAEALACGTPIASFARGAVAEILNASCGIMVPPGDVGALAQAARDVQHLRRSDCRRRAEDIADFGVMISQYEDMYHRLIQSAKPTQVKRKAVRRNFPEIPNARGLLDYYMAHRPAMLSEVPIGLRP